MAEQKHTPGPWEFEDGFILANGEALKVVGVQVPMVVGPSRLEAIANARLIAAAPELLAALEKFEAHYSRGTNPFCDEAASMARAAIAKAQSQGTPA